MSQNLPPRLPKWPFVLGDLLLVGFAGLYAYYSSKPMLVSQGFVCLLAISCGAWICAVPFLREYKGLLKVAEADILASTVAQIRNLEEIRKQISAATGQWQEVQQCSIQTVAAAREITDRMKAELGEFCTFLQNARDTEKNHLKLEVEKLRRGERDWLQATVHILDHVFALHNAALRAGQPTVVAQLNQFQAACREAVRRLGLVPFAPAAKDCFDPQMHQLTEGQATPDSGMQVSELLAVGYTYQGEVARRALVRVTPVPPDIQSGGSAAG